MTEGFFSSEEYDERAHQLYNQGDFDGALAMLKEGLALYPAAVELYVGLGYARLAREEYAWARMAFQQARVLDPAHEDALVGLGETLLRFGEKERALRLFREAQKLGGEEGLDILLTVGRALYREGLFIEARNVFAKAVAASPADPDALASLGYALHRNGDEVGACRQIRRALRVDPGFHEARVYLGHILYDRGDQEGALREFESVPPQDHFDSLAVWRLMELVRVLRELDREDTRLAPWVERFEQLEADSDPLDRMLAEIEASFNGDGPWLRPDRNQLELFEPSSADLQVRQVRTPEGVVFRGTWYDIVRSMRDHAGFSHETLVEFMRRMAERWREHTGIDVPFSDPEDFLLTAIQVGLLILDDVPGEP